MTPVLSATVFDSHLGYLDDALASRPQSGVRCRSPRCLDTRWSDRASGQRTRDAHHPSARAGPFPKGDSFVLSVTWTDEGDNSATAESVFRR
jgi:hypothetical protein